MRHEEENHWHPADRRHPENRRREHSLYQEERPFNDFGSRWGEPDPRFNPRQQDWQPREGDRRGEHRDPRDDWRAFEQQIEEQRRHPGPNHWEREHREPAWQQRDRHFSSNNQHANDRWQEGEIPPHPDERRHPDAEQERRRRRYYRED